MKICVALHSCMDLGGIINHTEQLIGGLQDLGHDVHLREMVWSVTAPGQSKKADMAYGPSGIPHHQGKGWNFRREQRIPYKGAKMIQALCTLGEYDMIIWTVPVPPKNKLNIGNACWPHLYDLPSRVKQVAFVHDGNSKSNSGHLLAVQDHLSALCCVHPCALNGADFTNLPRALTLNPQHIPLRPKRPWDQKLPGFVSMQTFKAWKHAHELVGAIRYMPAKKTMEMRDIAGKGIEYQYLTSVDKCKEAYFHPDGERFWETAVANGMIHHDYWSADQVDDRLIQSRILVDPSWSNRYSRIGGHFNRVVVDAMIRGCVPVARRLGMGDEFFVAGQHYIPIDENADAQEYADTVIAAGNMQERYAKQFRSNVTELLVLFDRRRIAQQVVDMAHGNFDMLPPSSGPTARHYDKIDDVLFNHFGVLL